MTALAAPWQDVERSIESVANPVRRVAGRFGGSGNLLIGEALSVSVKKLLVLVSLLCSCRTAGPAPAPPQGEPLLFGAVPTGDPETRRKELSALAAHLEQSLGVPVALEVPNDYAETARTLAAGRWDLVLLGPVLYSRAHEMGYDAVAMPVRGGVSVFAGVLITGADGPVRTVAELRGKRIAFVDPNSSAGFQYPFAHLFANGLKPSDYERVFVGGHHAVVRQVLDGALDAGACYEDAIDEALSPEERARIAVIAKTEPVPGDVFAARRDSPHFEALRKALLDLRGEAAAPLLAPLHAEGMQAPDERLFDSARRIDLLVSEEAGL